MTQVATPNETSASRKTSLASGETEYATFYVNGLWMAADIIQIQEINRNLEMTPVPHAPECVRGVVNLRGEVVTVLDLRTILGFESAEITDDCRNVIVVSGGEHIGLLVDRVGDVVHTRPDQLSPPPANVQGVEARFFLGVHQADEDLLAILDISQVLENDEERTDG